MPQSKKETTAKKVKPKAAATGKTTVAKPAATTGAARKPGTDKKNTSKVASEKPKTAATSKKMVEKAKEIKKIAKNKSAKAGVDSHNTGSVKYEQTARNAQKADSESANASLSSSKTQKKETELADSISQGLAKHGQKKRGWRDIEALTERARLKSLLSDIWHEDIDLDSDIFGEADHLTGYYTDKEEEIEVEDDEDEEWEEFEDDED